jgi:hypothetical protein
MMNPQMRDFLRLRRSRESHDALLAVSWVQMRGMEGRHTVLVRFVFLGRRLWLLRPCELLLRNVSRRMDLGRVPWCV